jgi:menaquinone-dependent protoporphyrinogen oxidase
MDPTGGRLCADTEGNGRAIAPRLEDSMARILVLFGTTDGHTARIAASIANTLRAAGDQVDVLEASRHTPGPTDYAAVVIAASVHGGRFQRHVRAWVRRHVYELNARPTSFVSVCLGVLQTEPAVQREVQAIVTRFLVATGWRPAMTTLVPGALLYRQYNWLKRWVMKRIVAKAGGDTDTSRNWEYTDWGEVRAFAERFAAFVHGGCHAPAAPSHDTQAA